MYRFIFIFWGIVFWASPLLGKLEIKYDRFKKQTVVSTVPRALPPGRPCLSLFTTFSGQTPPGPPETIVISFNSVNKSWEYLRCNDTTLLIDDEPFSLDKGTHSGDVLSAGSVFEGVYFTIPFKKITEMSKANKIEGKICNTEFVFSEEEIQDIKDLIKVFIPKSQCNAL